MIFITALLFNFLVWAVVITYTDVRTRKIRNVHNSLFTLITLALLFIPHHLKNYQHGLSYGIIGAFIFFILFLVARLISRGKIGMGDVKLAFPIGLNIGILQQSALEASFLFVFLSAGVAALVSKARGKSLNDSLPFAPFIFLGSALGMSLMLASHS